MHAAPTDASRQPGFETKEQRKMRVNVEKTWRRFLHGGQQTLRTESILNRDQGRHRDLEDAHKEWGEGAVHPRLEILLLPLAVYVIDQIAFSSAAEYAAILMFPQWSTLATVFRFLVPVGILVGEVAISGLRYAAIEAEDNNARLGGIRFSVIFWTAVGVVWPLGMAAVAIYTGWVAENQPGVPPDPLSWVLPVSLGVLSFVGHLAVLFAGEAMFDAHDYASYRLRHRHYTRRIDRQSQRYEREAQAAFAIYVVFHQDYQRYNDLHKPALPFGPIEIPVRQLINRRAGQDVIEVPGGGSDQLPNTHADDPDAANGAPANPPQPQIAPATPPPSTTPSSAATVEPSPFAPTDAEWNPFI